MRGDVHRFQSDAAHDVDGETGGLHFGVADLFLDRAGQQAADHLAAHGRSPAALRDGVGNECVAVPLEIGRLHPAPAFRY